MVKWEKGRIKMKILSMAWNIYDDRIKKVYDFSFPDVKEKGILSVKFFVLSVFGEEEFTLEVNI